MTKITRKFSSYGPVDTDLHYYVPRQTLLDETLLKLIGENTQKGGHYITVWAPRQCGKTWVLLETLAILRHNTQYKEFDGVYIPLETLKQETDVSFVIKVITRKILEALKIDATPASNVDEFEQIFKNTVLSKPLILVLDEFDALAPEAISSIIGAFRNIYISRRNQNDKPSADRDYLLHGVALIGVRAVLGIENKSGSPFNVQQSVHISNFSFAEVEAMYKWYQQDSGQQVEQAVIERVFYETNGQPGLVSWLGELLTVNFNKHNPSITSQDFDIAYSAAINALPNANVTNIISKANQEPYKPLVLKLFETQEKLTFRYENPTINFLYMNGVIDEEIVNEMERYIKFSSPFIQKKLFNYFAVRLFDYIGELYDPFDNLDDVFTTQGLHISNLLKRYEAYLQKNRHWLFEGAPRRHDLRIYEAVYHFNLYMYLFKFIKRRSGRVWPEFPTGNGKIDIIINFEDKRYGLELKSFTDNHEYNQALKQAALYAHQLNLTEITLLLFIEAIDDKNRAKLETVYTDVERGIKVIPTFVATGT